MAKRLQLDADDLAVIVALVEFMELSEALKPDSQLLAFGKSLSGRALDFISDQPQSTEDPINDRIVELTEDIPWLASTGRKRRGARGKVAPAQGRRR